VQLPGLDRAGLDPGVYTSREDDKPVCPWLANDPLLPMGGSRLASPGSGQRMNTGSKSFIPRRRKLLPSFAM
jgi:hypothetical protein